MRPISTIKMALIAWLAGELAAFFLLVSALGLALTLLLGFVTTAAGLVLLGKSSRSTFEGLQTRKREEFTFVLLGPAHILAAILLIFPGFLSDLFGLFLCVPPIGRFVSSKISASFRKSEADILDLDASEWQPGEDGLKDITKLTHQP